MSRGVGQGGFPNPNQDPFAGMGFGFGASLFNDPIFADPFFADPFGSMFGRQAGTAGRGFPGGGFGEPFGFDLPHQQHLQNHRRQHQEQHSRHLQQQQQQQQEQLQYQQQQQRQRQQQQQQQQQRVSAPSIQEVRDDETGLPGYQPSARRAGATGPGSRGTGGGERAGRRSRSYNADEPIVELPDDDEEEEQDGKRRREGEEEEEEGERVHEQQQQYPQQRRSGYQQQQQQPPQRGSMRQEDRGPQQAAPNSTHQTLVASSSPFNALGLFGGGFGGLAGGAFGAGMGGGSSSYSFQSSSVTYSGIGGQTYYSESSSHQVAANGVVEAQHSRRDSRGHQSMTVARGLGDKARTLSCTREGEQQRSYEVLHNMSQEEAATFDSTWQHHARHALPPSASTPAAPSARLALPSTTLPQPSSTSRGSRPSGGARGGGQTYGY
ncbi:hypothetical protein CLOM_g22544 [Closterium sp. NIES-68]|nr:hypothetical protein CLOM_g22544 [Closterium sp. NIES-68]GJP72710.1 hypothetical protein CLOP_g3468 [Closterium sp. NIES-67]